ncbi:hypothetical protein Ahy_B03g063888 isoform D [Arachis hypogaea]|uniref:Uncharacterized protein n=1 Tax=Arachis hypogaea TaxID=3818 RepID=A0A444ZYB6_ARAHY|nr:hypothetical protein Ahy_B03g063888 isoform D [Arachis hypogaea]
MSGVALEGFASLCLLSHCRKGVDNSAIGISRTKSMHGVDHRNHFGNLVDITTIGTSAGAGAGAGAGGGGGGGKGVGGGGYFCPEKVKKTILIRKKNVKDDSK